MLRGIDAGSGRAIEIEIEAGRITALREVETGRETEAGRETETPWAARAGRDAAGVRGLPLLAPGFVDLQVNGYLGVDYSQGDLEQGHVRSLLRSLDASGTTQHVPTIVTSPRERILRNLEVIRRAADSYPDVGAAIAGVHIEGPFISPEDGPRGAHDPAFVRPPDLEEVRRWQEAAGGRIRIVTLAPELEGALELIGELASMGIVPAIGHTAAAPATIRQAVAAGARLSTHLGNGSHLHLPRLRNYLWEQLADDTLKASIIADGFHLPEAVLRVFARVKGPERLILVSDVAQFGGCPRGRYRWGNIEVEVFPDGHLALPGTEILAGAGHTLDWDLAHFVRITGVTLAEALPMCTRNPARVLGLPEEYATLAPGAPANLVVFHHRPEEPRLRILKTIRAGRVVYPRS